MTIEKRHGRTYYVVREIVRAVAKGIILAAVVLVIWGTIVVWSAVP